MGDTFSWQCPFCQHFATITDQHQSASRFEFGGTHCRHGYQALRARAVICPNSACREACLTVSLHDHKVVGQQYQDLPAKRVWKLIPEADMKIMPEYVPRTIVCDYQEACLIRETSPKASATLARRCLQGMIRDFWQVKPGRLVDEIEAIADRVDPTTWRAIDAVRQIGNIGAHMEKDINTMIDVDPDEATLLIGLIETLIEDWYVARETRNQRMARLTAAAEAKRHPK